MLFIQTYKVTQMINLTFLLTFRQMDFCEFGEISVKPSSQASSYGLVLLTGPILGSM